MANNELIDANREVLLDAQFLHSVVSLLDRYAESTPPPGLPAKPLPLSIPQLKIMRTAIGVLLNATIGYGMFNLIGYLLHRLTPAQNLLDRASPLWKLPSPYYVCPPLCIRLVVGRSRKDLLAQRILPPTNPLSNPGLFGVGSLTGRGGCYPS
jgi:hypothetical protein